jgi:hypothetical protein
MNWTSVNKSAASAVLSAVVMIATSNSAAFAQSSPGIPQCGPSPAQNLRDMVDIMAAAPHAVCPERVAGDPRLHFNGAGPGAYIPLCVYFAGGCDDSSTASVAGSGQQAPNSHSQTQTNAQPATAIQQVNAVSPAPSGKASAIQPAVDPVSYGGYGYDLGTSAGRTQLVQDGKNNVVPSGPGGASIQRLLDAHPQSASGKASAIQPAIDPVSYGGYGYDLGTSAGRTQLIQDGKNNVVPSGPSGASIQRLLDTHPQR